MPTMTTPAKRPRGRPRKTDTAAPVRAPKLKLKRSGPFTRDDLETLLDALSIAAEASSKPGEVLRLFERVEHEIAALEDEGAVLDRVRKRARKAKRGRS